MRLFTSLLLLLSLFGLEVSYPQDIAFTQSEVRSTQPDWQTITDAAPKPYRLRADYYFKAIPKYLEQGGDPRSKDKKDFTILHAAALSGSQDLIAFLIQKGADVNAKDNFGATAFLYAAGSGSTEAIEYLIDKGLDPKSPSLLSAAAASGSMKVVKLLIKKGANCLGKDELGRPILHRAIQSRNRELVDYFLELGADPKAQNNLGVNSLFIASTLGNLDLIKLMLNRGVDPNIKSADGTTVLHLVAFFYPTWTNDDSVIVNTNNTIKAIQLLLSRGANPRAVAADGATVLHKAVLSGDIEIVKLILDQKVDINARNIKGQTPLRIAVEDKSTEIINFLKSKGAVD